MPSPPPNYRAIAYKRAHDTLYDHAQAFANAAKQIRQQGEDLKNLATVYFEDPRFWSGGETSNLWQDAWVRYHMHREAAADILEKSSKALFDVLTNVDNISQQIAQAQLQALPYQIAFGVLTLLDIAQLGADFFSDGLTVADGAKLAQLQSDEEAALERISETDIETSTAFTNLEGSINAVEKLDDIPLSYTPDPLTPFGPSTGLSQYGNMGSTSTLFQQSLDDGMPGVRTSFGESLIQDLKNQGINVVEDEEGDAYLNFAKSNGSTSFDGSSPNNTWVTLKQGSSDYTIYEEWLHAQEGKSRGWVGITPPESLMEEVKVETQVLEDATAGKLQMSPKELQGLTTIRDGYARTLNTTYGMVQDPDTGKWIMSGDVTLEWDPTTRQWMPYNP